jgi:hypothetical protein
MPPRREVRFQVTYSCPERNPGQRGFGCRRHVRAACFLVVVFVFHRHDARQSSTLEVIRTICEILESVKDSVDTRALHYFVK